MSVEKLLGLALAALFARALYQPKKTAPPEIQRLFERFHESIKLEENDERLKLRTKRDLLLEMLRQKMAVHSLTFEAFDQGSYAMRTGVVPLSGNYDIDVGIIFDCSDKQFPNPVDLKQLVHDALAEKNRTVSIRRACVTVTYIREGVPDYHVDLALYRRGWGGTLLLAMGRHHSDESKRKWVASTPLEVRDFVLSRFKGEDQAQLRRCIRYLKRWRSENFTAGAPVSIALTVAAARWFKPCVNEDGARFDLGALHALVKKMLNNFALDGRLVIPLPQQFGTDLMKKMTNKQMDAFQKRLKQLDHVLSQCYEETNLPAAEALLASEFGSDFPASLEPTFA